ncbi:MAG: hypothetical protein K2W85_03245 [Phycisphaerales bacterium]|nr:hypothetical protein [Phycisphaerales bacterium]
MSSTQRSFDQVRSILGKLDRNIDAARERRLQVAPAAGPMPLPVAAPAPIPAPARPAFAPAPAPMPTFSSAAPQRSAYGRAQPMRPDRRSQTGT